MILKNIFKYILVFIILTWIWISFIHINKSNYKKISDIKVYNVKHPENLSKVEFVKYSSFWFYNIMADIYWLETIQYIASNAISAEYKKYLYHITNSINKLNPEFRHPYHIAMMLLPSNNSFSWKKIDEKKQLEYIKQSETIWLRAIKNFCDLEKIELIKKETNLQKIWSEEKYKNPCRDDMIPYNLAYIYNYYLHKPEIASYYYKIASANTDSLAWAKYLTAIMSWKGWEREKSYFMFLNIWKDLDNSDEQFCSKYISILDDLWKKIFKEKNIDSNKIKYISDSNKKIFWDYDSKSESALKKECPNYVNKATREINLYYIEQANKKYKLNNENKSAINAKILFEKWYLDYLPLDFQQLENYGIIYIYNNKTWHFDYKMWKY